MATQTECPVERKQGTVREEWAAAVSLAIVILAVVLI